MTVRVLGVACLLFLVLLSPAAAQQDHDQVVAVSLGGSTVLQLDSTTARRVTLTDPSIAEVQAAAGGLLIIGRKVGETNLVLFGDGPDPQKLLKGSGKQARHIVLEDATVVDRPDVRALMDRALERAARPLNAAAPNRIVIKSISARQRPRRPAQR